MTNKQFEVKEYLSSLRFAEKMIEIKLEKIEETRELAVRVNQALNPVKVQGGQRKNIVEEVAIKVVELTYQLEEQEEKYKELQSNVIKLIESVEDETQRQILDLRYVHFKKWEEISDVLNYERTWVSRIHYKGIQSILDSKLYKKLKSTKNNI